MKRLRFRREHFLGASVLVALVVLAVVLSYQQALRQLEARAQAVARGLVQRTEQISLQVDRAMEAMGTTENIQPCSAANIRKMRRVAMGNSRLQLVGYVQQDQLLCSSYGVHQPPIALGAPTYVSQLGYALRVGRQLPMADSSKFVISTYVRTGYSVAVLSQLTPSSTAERPTLGQGLFGASSRKIMHFEGTLEPRWLQLLQDGSYSAMVVEQDRLVAVVRSRNYDYAGFVALSLAELHDDWLYYSVVLVPLAAALGLALAMLIVIAARSRRSLNAQLRHALQHRHGLFLHYQPIVDLATGRWVGAEALLRWRKADGNLVPPDVFIPRAESAGLMRQLTTRMLELLAQDLPPVYREFPDFYVSVNLSAQDLADEQGVNDLQSLMERSGIAPHQLRAEVTERMLVHAEAAQRNLKRLRQLGVAAAIDDFGTGYCGLAYLTTLELDTLKIDKVFIDTIGTDAATSHVVGHIIDIGKSLQLSLIAEGVETEQQVRYLQKQGVPFAQGWFYAAAMSVEKLREALIRQTTQASDVPEFMLHP
jgi:sensor c-di-GMP phosphodiesterase-like protein